jgi:hypothetical protein
VLLSLPVFFSTFNEISIVMQRSSSKAQQQTHKEAHEMEITLRTVFSFFLRPLRAASAFVSQIPQLSRSSEFSASLRTSIVGLVLVVISTRSTKAKEALRKCVIISLCSSTGVC